MPPLKTLQNFNYPLILPLPKINYQGSSVFRNLTVVAFHALFLADNEIA
jgi:hypothetical protein